MWLICKTISPISRLRTFVSEEPGLGRKHKTACFATDAELHSLQFQLNTLDNTFTYLAIQ